MATRWNREDVVKPPAETGKSRHRRTRLILTSETRFCRRYRRRQQSNLPGKRRVRTPSSKASQALLRLKIHSAADPGRDEVRAQDELPDFEDGQNDYSTAELLAGLGPNLLPEYSSLDVIHVKQMFEARLLTVARIIEVSDSFEAACGYLFAFPEDVGGVEVIRRAWSLCQGERDASGGISGDARNDVEETFTLDDVQQFVEVDGETTDAGDAAYYEEMLETVFEFDIEWGNNDENRLNQLQNLAKANIHFFNYLAAEEGLNLGVDKALEEFWKHFSRTDQGKLKVRLGDNDATDGKFFGRVPLPESTQEDLDYIYLGSEVDIPTIVHEFGHVIDRNIDLRSYLQDSDRPDGRSRLASDAGIYGINLDQILDLAIGGFAAKQFYARELWADLFMTAVLDPSVSGKTYEVYSILSDALDDYYTLFEGMDEGDNPFFDCNGYEERVVCGPRPIQWRRFGNGIGDLTGNARAAVKRLKELIPMWLATHSGDSANE